ncbi:MAG: nucleotidyltransferase substrate binding protein [Thermodesulfovibrionales bacterium]
MKEKKRLQYALDRFSDAHKRLREAINEKETPLSIDGTIQRFEFTFELAWKVIQKFIRYEGFDCNTPRECLRKAYSAGIIDNDEIWLDMLDDRNKTSHIYNEAVAKGIFNRIRQDYVMELEGLRDLLSKRLERL